MSCIMAVIQAGGLGTRMRSITKDLIPKPLLELNGKPMIQWQIENLKEYGITEFSIIIGHMGDRIRDFFDDGSSLGVKINYISEDQPLGSAGALYFLKKLHFDRYIFIYGDVMFDMDIDRWMDFHIRNGAEITCVCHPNSHPQDSDIVKVDAKDRIVKFLWKKEKRDEWFSNLVNAGLFIFEPDVLEDIMAPAKTDWEREIVDRHVKGGKVFAYRTSEYIKDAGTPERFYKAEREQKEGYWKKKNLRKKQKCVFLDRDGTINELNGLIHKTEQFVLERCAAQAIRAFNDLGMLVIVCTNQPVVARGMCEIDDVVRIHNKMQTLLGKDGAYIDDIIFCPHHPDKGYPEENPKYKISCNCRKPNIGMIEEMSQKYNIDLGKSYFIGDTTVDIKTGINAGMKTILVKTGEAGLDGKFDVKPDYEAVDLLDAANLITSMEVEHGLQ